MSGAVAIFVKTPGLSPVKSRLAATMGTGFAQGLHRRAAQATASVVECALAECGGIGYWAVAERTDAARGAWRGFETIMQGEGSLGERMARVHTALVARHGLALLIGADSPQLELSPLCAAINWLRAPGPRLVLGPAEDGGFWLAGANRALPLGDWTGVEYSRPDTCAGFSRVMRRHGRLLEMPLLRDVDRADDLPSLMNALQILPAATPAQAALLGWLEAHRISGGTDA